MTSGDRLEVFTLLSEYLNRDEFARDANAAYRAEAPSREALDAAIAEALTLFLDRPDYGFVWLGFEDGRLAGCASVGYAISLALGKVVASLDVFYVAPGTEAGLGVELFESLAEVLEAAEVARVDVFVHHDDAGRQAFYSRLGFDSLREERMALLLD